MDLLKIIYTNIYGHHFQMSLIMTLIFISRYIFLVFSKIQHHFWFQQGIFFLLCTCCARWAWATNQGVYWFPPNIQKQIWPDGSWVDAGFAATAELSKHAATQQWDVQQPRGIHVDRFWKSVCSQVYSLALYKGVLVLKESCLVLIVL